MMTKDGGHNLTAAEIPINISRLEASAEGSVGIRSGSAPPRLPQWLYGAGLFAMLLGTHDLVRSF